MEKYVNGKCFVDTSHPELDDIISEAWRRLGRYNAARCEFESANEAYIRARARVESGRLPRYGSPLGVRVTSSGGGHSVEDSVLDLVEMGRHVEDLRRGLALAYAATDCVIRKSCYWGSKPGVVLREEYLSDEGFVAADLCRKYPDRFPHRSSVQYWQRKGFEFVALRIQDEHNDRDRCCEDIMCD